MFNDIAETMPWVAAPFETERQAIKQHHGVNGIPMLPVFKADGTKIVDNGRQVVHKSQTEKTQAALIEQWSQL